MQFGVIAQAFHRADLSYLLLRWLVGAFLVWGVWDNVVSPARLDEFAAFLAANDFPWPAVMARLSVYAQLGVGLALLTGAFVRVAGVVCAFNFFIALVMVDLPLGLRAAFPAALLVLLGVHFASRGAGAASIDAWWAKRRRPTGKAVH